MSRRRVHIVVHIAIDADNVEGLAAAYAQLQREVVSITKARPDIGVTISGFDPDQVIGSIED